MSNLIPIRKYKINKRGLRGTTIALPLIWAEEQNLKKDDKLLVMQSEDSPDDLILRKLTDNSIVIYKASPRGRKSFCVAIPPEWTRERDVKLGDTLLFLQSANSDDLIIRILKEE